MRGMCRLRCRNHGTNHRTKAQPDTTNERMWNVNCRQFLAGLLALTACTPASTSLRRGLKPAPALSRSSATRRRSSSPPRTRPTRRRSRWLTRRRRCRRTWRAWRPIPTRRRRMPPSFPGGASFLTVNEVRAGENLPPVPDGDTIFQPLQPGRRRLASFRRSARRRRPAPESTLPVQDPPGTSSGKHLNGHAA